MQTKYYQILLTISNKVLQSYTKSKTKIIFETKCKIQSHQIQHNIQTWLANGSFLNIMNPLMKKHNTRQ